MSTWRWIGHLDLLADLVGRFSSRSVVHFRIPVMRIYFLHKRIGGLKGCPEYRSMILSGLREGNGFCGNLLEVNLI